MFRQLLLISVLVVLGHTASITFDQSETVWKDFKTKFQRNYKTDEEVLRKLIFLRNVDLITKHNREADLGQHTYWLGINQFTDWTNEEFKQRNTLKIGRSNTNASLFMAPENLGSLPKHVDWRQKGYVTKVKNQEQCGSCWAFSATGSLEGQHFRKTGKLVSLSEQNLVDCSRAEGNDGCEGGLMDQAFEYIKKNHGIDREDCYPYEAEDKRCRFKTACIGATLVGYKDVKQGDEDALKVAVATVGPISIAIDASHSSFQMYSHGIYNEPDCSSENLDHGVLAVGYGTQIGSRKKDFWIVKNSWGEDWGMNGYIHMSRNKDNQCGVATQASYPLV